MTDGTASVSNEVLLGAFAIIQILGVALSKIIDGFIDRDRTAALESRLDDLVEQDKIRMDLINQANKARFEDSRMLSDLYSIHKVTDSEGRPAWYFPRKMMDIADQHLEHLRDISLAQKEAALTLESIFKRLSAPRKGVRDVD